MARIPQLSAIKMIEVLHASALIIRTIHALISDWLSVQTCLDN